MMEEFNIDRPKTHVEWVLGNQCNYQCSYCHETFRLGDKPYPSEETIINVCRDIVFHYDDLGRDVVFHFIGGEPTLSRGLSTIGQRLSNHPVDLVLRTNGSASIEWWTDAKPYISSVVISAHKEFCSLNHLEEVISLLRDASDSNPVNVSLLIPTTHDIASWNWALQVRKRFQSKFQIGELQMLYSNFGRGSNIFYPYSNEQWNQYNAFKGIPPKVNDPELKISTGVFNKQIELQFRPEVKFNGRTCYAGIDILTIDTTGKIWRGWCQQGGVIGSIYELPIVWPTGPIVCQKEICSNGFDQQARKELNSS